MTKEIEITRGKKTIVDDDIFELVSKVKWYCTSTGYARNDNFGYLHRFVLGLNGELQADHINRNRLDNRRCNLRIATHNDNQRNRGAMRTNTSGYKGVSIRGKYIDAHLMVNNKKRHIGYFPDLISAAKAYDAEAKKYYGDFAVLNFPE